MQPQNFLKPINGQAVAPYSCFSVLSLSEKEGSVTFVSLTQNRGDVGARCALACNVLSPHNGSRHVGMMAARDSQIAKWA